MAKPKKDDSSHYVDNKKLLEAINEYQKMCLDQGEDEDTPQIPNYIGECIYLICSNLTNRPNFINYPYKDDMIGEAIHDCIKAVPKFNAEISSNPFAYFTQIAWFAFIRTIKKEKKQDITVYALVQSSNGLGHYTKWLQDNGHLDQHATPEDLQRYHYLTDEDLKEIEDATKAKKKTRKKKTSPKKKSLFDEDTE